MKEVKKIWFTGNTEHKVSPENCEIIFLKDKFGVRVNREIGNRISIILQCR